MTIFDRSRHRQYRARAAKMIATHDPVLLACAERLADSLDDIQRDFLTIVELGSRHGFMQPHLHDRYPEAMVTACDLSPEMLVANPATMRLATHEETLPFAENSVDAVISCMGLHWVNDLPGTLAQIQRILKPDGLFLASLPGPATLHEWKQAAMLAAESLGCGLPPMISPFVDVRDAGGLLQRAGFSLPVVDQDVLTIDYANPMQLCADLRHCGESNALVTQPKHCLGNAWFAALNETYQTHFANPDGSVYATLEIITLTAWSPHASQQKPAKRGSGSISLGDVLK